MLFALSALAIDLIIQLTLARVIAGHFEGRPRLRARLFPADPRATPFEVRTRDGITLRGSILESGWRSSRGVIVYCHEFGGDRWSYQNYFHPEVVKGFDIVTFDFRNSGESDRLERYEPMHWLTQHELADLAAVVDYVRAEPRWRETPLVLAGSSRGGNAALALAGRRNDVQGVAAVGAFSTHSLAMQHLIKGIRQRAAWVLAVPRWHIRSTLEMAIVWSGARLGSRFVRLERKLPALRGRPVLLIAGEADAHIPSDMSERLRGLAGTGAELVTISGGRHNTERDADPEQFDRALRNLLENVSSEASTLRFADHRLTTVDAA